ncbi:MAG: sigma-70 family RNA polymerase sigma factor [Planctomycetota bacterium]
MNGPDRVPADPAQALDVTVLIRDAQGGNGQAVERLLEIVYAQLRATAGSYFRGQPSNHTLQPTALVHEAYLKLVGNTDKEWQGRAHFCAVAATAMRHILRDHARAKRAEKRGGEAHRVEATLIESPSSTSIVDVLALEEALDRLSEIDKEGARVVELRYFGGLTHEQVVVELGVSLSSVERAWRRCRAWLKPRLSGDGR